MKTINISLALLVILVAGCEGPKGETGPVGGNGAKLRGNITGYVTLIDSMGNPSKDNSGIKVTLLPGNFLDTTTTDSTGRWELVNVESGTKKIMFNKEKYFGESIEGLQFVGDGTMYLDPVSLYLIPTYYVSNYYGTINTSNSSITIGGEVINILPTQQKVVILSFDTSYTVGPYNNYFLFYELIGFPYNSNIFSHTIIMDSTFKAKNKIKKGTKLYVSALTCSPYAPLIVYNKSNGKMIPAHFGHLQPGVPIGIPEFIVP